MFTDAKSYKPYDVLNDPLTHSLKDIEKDEKILSSSKV